MIEAVIFDFDGVVADTMADNYAAWQHAFAAFNFSVDPHEYYKLEGMGRYQIATHFITTYNLDPAIKEEIVTTKELFYKNNNTFKIYDEIEYIFELLKHKNIPIAVVTGASKARIEDHFEPRLVAQLSALVTADDVVNTKPHPEPYLNAITKLNKNVANCMVIENAILGIQSAKAAGCKCFALETTLPKEELNLADEVFATHAALLSRLQTIFEK
jgi:beta-phosphoglucomutase